MPDSAAAEKAFEAGRGRAAAALPGTIMSDVPVGQRGAMGVAEWKGGTKLANTVAFHGGTAVVAIELDSPVNQPFPQGFPDAVAQQQDAAIRSGSSG